MIKFTLHDTKIILEETGERIALDGSLLSEFYIAKNNSLIYSLDLSYVTDVAINITAIQTSNYTITSEIYNL